MGWDDEPDEVEGGLQMGLGLSCIRTASDTCFPPIPDQSSLGALAGLGSRSFPTWVLQLPGNGRAGADALAMVSAACWAAPPLVVLLGLHLSLPQHGPL